MTYTCNKKAYPSFQNDCKNCYEYEPCAKGSKWCFVAAIENDKIANRTMQDTVESAAAPVMRDTSTVTINFSEGMKVDVLREDIKKRLEHDLYKAIGLPGFINGA